MAATGTDMLISRAVELPPRRPLRLWPGIVAVVLQWIIRFLLPLVFPGTAGFAAIGAVAGGLAVLLWWLFFSRARWFERLGAVLLMVLAVSATSQLVHDSIANGMMGLMLPVYSIPFLSLVLVTSAAVGRHVSDGLRYAFLVAGVLLACSAMTLVRTGGITGDAVSDLHWRWTKSPEEQLLAKPLSPPATLAPAASSVLGKASWLGFRGSERDAIIPGLQIATNWQTSPPVELWRRSVGPAWSSFAVQGNVFFTQEQRGEDEVVSCYNLATGASVWSHRDEARFWESNAGAGPRGTPTLSNGRIYTFGGTGILNALDARNGSVVWSRNAASDTGKKVPHWGFSSSPLVLHDMVIIATAGVLAAYDVGTGSLRWIGPPGPGGYSSPHLSTIAGVAQVVFVNGAGVAGVAPSDGKLLWNHAWPGDGIVQPTVLADGRVLIGSGSGLAGKVGVRCLAVTRGPDNWTAEERWTSTGLKPYFNDFVVHKDHAFGLDGGILACIDLKDGHRKWKQGRYGYGQLALIPLQDLLLVLSEKGELALVNANPNAFAEIARLQAIQGKTWNHPVLVNDVLLVRNSQEMAAFRLALVGH